MSSSFWSYNVDVCMYISIYVHINLSVSYLSISNHLYIELYVKLLILCGYMYVAILSQLARWTSLAPQSSTKHLFSVNICPYHLVSMDVKPILLKTACYWIMEDCRYAIEKYTFILLSKHLLRLFSSLLIHELRISTKPFLFKA